MTVGELIETIIRMRGRQYGEDIMMGWLNEIEGQVIEEIVNRAEGYNVTFKPLSYDLDAAKELTIPTRFQDVYIHYMLSKIDYHNQAWFRRENMPKRGASFSGF